MDDIFSGLSRPQIDEMKLEEKEDTRDKNKEKDTISEDRVITTFVENELEESEELDTSSISSSEPVHRTDNSSSTSSTSSTTSREMVSLKDYQTLQISYSRDTHTQLLVAVIGREFDEPQQVASKLQPLAPLDLNHTPLMKFVPFTVRRSILIKANFEWQDLKSHDLICLCYNASEARILLTGPDGFYTRLVKNLEAILGSNKVAFLVTHYMSSSPEEDHTSSLNELISPELATRLNVQVDLVKYLQHNQVLSWYDQPCDSHVTKLIELAQSDINPEGFLNCRIL